MMKNDIDGTLDALGAQIATAFGRAVGAVMRERGIPRPTEEQLDQIMLLLKDEAKASVRTILDDSRALVEGGMSGWTPIVVANEALRGAKKIVDTLYPSSIKG